MGYPDCPRGYPILRHVLLPKVASLAGSAGPLGGSVRKFFLFCKWSSLTTSSIQVLAKVHGNGDINNPKVLAQYQEIEEAIRFEREEAVNSYKALVEPRMLKRVILGMSIQMWSQLCGMK